MQEVTGITVKELLELKEKNIDFVILDVREQSEYNADNMGGRLIPVNQLAERLDELDKDSLIIVHCKTGGRSHTACEILLNAGFKNAKNLLGGITAWREAGNHAK